MSDRPPLRFRPDGTFTIVQLTDVHWHNGEEDDLRSRAMIERILDAEQPELVALTGDVVGGYDSRDPGEALRRVLAPLEERGLPWASAFGNHDDEGRLTRLELLDVQLEHRCCRTERGPEDLSGVGNFVLPVLGARGDVPEAALYFLDSGSYTETGVGSYAWFGRDQIAWYLSQARALQAAHAAGPDGPGRSERLPALAFFHIPLPEYDEVWDHWPCRGSKHETVCAPAVNSGLFAALVEAGDMVGVFVGHDHVNDYEGELWGIRLCYGRCSGHSPYGLDGFQRGARVIRLREGRRDFETWLRLDDGSAVADLPVHEPRGRVLSDPPAGGGGLPTA